MLFCSMCWFMYSQFRGLDVPGSAFDGVAVVGGELGDDLQQGGAVVFHRLPVAVESGLVLSGEYRDSCLELREAVPDVMHEQSAQGASQVARTTAGG